MVKSRSRVSPALARAIRINTYLFSLICGISCAGLFLLSTFVLIWQGGDSVGEHLSLFAIFLPGYGMSAAGAWAGAFWVAIFAAASGGILYATYARTLGGKIVEQSIGAQDQSGSDVIAPIAKMSGNALGLGLGLMVAVQLVLTTSWLVIRGTADSSHHAALLANFLPGYSVSFVGSLIGAVQLFSVVYVLCRILAGIYNAIVTRKTKGMAA